MILLNLVMILRTKFFQLYNLTKRFYYILLLLDWRTRYLVFFTRAALRRRSFFSKKRLPENQTTCLTSSSLYEFKPQGNGDLLKINRMQDHSEVKEIFISDTAQHLIFSPVNSKKLICLLKAKKSLHQNRNKLLYNETLYLN